MARIRRGSPGLARLGSIIEGSLGGQKLEHMLAEVKIKDLWTRAVGKKLSAISRPLRLIGRTLHVTVSSSPWMTELRYHTDVIVGKINSLAGENVVDKMVLKPGRVDRPVDAQEPGIEQKPLKESPHRPGPSGTEKKFIEQTVAPVDDPLLRDLIRRVLAKRGEQGW